MGQFSRLADRFEPQEIHFGYQSEVLQPRWTPLTRTAVGLIGFLSLLVAKKLHPKHPKAKMTVGLFGVASLLRALTNKNVTELVGLIANPVIRLNRSVILEASIDDTFDFLKNFSNYPKFMSYITEVRLNDMGGLQWTAKGPTGALVHWNATVGELLTNQTVSWRSAAGAWIRSGGRFHLSDFGDGRTRVEVELSYAPPVGALGYAAVHFLGFDPRMKIDEDLQILKNLIVTRTQSNSPSPAKSRERSI